MKTLINISIIFSFVVLPALAIDLPEEPPDDFFISYKVKSAEGDVPGFTFTASASGDASLEFEGKEGATFNIDINSVKKLYNAVCEYDSTSQGADADEEHMSYTVSREIRVVANGIEKTSNFSRGPALGSNPISDMVLEILDEYQPGWRD